jgi:hypothetical protein
MELGEEEKNFRTENNGRGRLVTTKPLPPSTRVPAGKPSATFISQVSGFPPFKIYIQSFLPDVNSAFAKFVCGRCNKEKVDALGAGCCFDGCSKFICSDCHGIEDRTTLELETTVVYCCNHNGGGLTAAGSRADAVS